MDIPVYFISDSVSNFTEYIIEFTDSVDLMWRVKDTEKVESIKYLDARFYMISPEFSFEASDLEDFLDNFNIYYVKHYR